MEPIRLHDKDGTLIVRDALLLAFFCKHPFHEMSEGVRQAFDLWHEAVPDDTLTWALVGAHASRYEPLTEETFEQCMAFLVPRKAAQREITAFEVRGDEEYSPAYAFRTVGQRELIDDDTLAETNLVEMRLPAAWLDERGVDRLVELAGRIAQCLPFDTGYASPALCWSADGRRRAAGAMIAPIALRHPGFDVHDNDTTRFFMGRRSRGARWLTFLSGAVAGELGGPDALRAALDNEVRVSDLPGGIMIRAGETPDVGDVNRRETLPLLCSVAAAIEDVTMFGELCLTDLLADDPEKLDRWERRFFPEEEGEAD